MAVSIYPNPVVNKTIGMTFTDMAGGMYIARLRNPLGGTILTKMINHTAGTTVENISLDRYTVPGIYQLEITGPGNTVKNLKVIVR